MGLEMENNKKCPYCGQGRNFCGAVTFSKDGVHCDSKTSINDGADKKDGVDQQKTKEENGCRPNES